MTTPDDPTQNPGAVPVQVPQPVPTESPTTTPDIRDLAIELAKPEFSFDPATLKKGVVTTASTANFTISVTISGDSTPIDGIRFIDSYSPVVGDTVLIAKQGTDLFALGQINDSNQGGASQGWATLTGSIQYRRVIDNGDVKVQMKGTSTYSATLGTLPTGFRPSAARRFTVARDGNAVAAACLVSTGGVVTLDGPDSVTSSSASITTTSDSHSHGVGSHSHGSHSHGGPGHSHTHGGTVPAASFAEGTGSSGVSSASLSTGSDSHSHSGGSHSHTVTPSSPSNVWLDGAEFFL